MPEATYPALYQDAAGSIATTITNDGTTLHIVLDDVPFSSGMLDDWERADPHGTLPQRFTIDCGYLRDFRLTFRVPVAVRLEQQRMAAPLHMSLEYTRAELAPRWGRVTIGLRLELPSGSFETPPVHTDVEPALVALRKQLPAQVSLQTCFFCGLSDYSPYGNGFFGCLACFRDNKAAYRAVRTKSDVFKIWSTHSGFVQETWTCPEWELRPPHAGYRG